ncbi:MAG: hypothetical protein ACPGSC_13465 [Granulosicoccaceae bacterium]
MSTENQDPISETARLCGGGESLSARMRHDLFEVVSKLKPALLDTPDLEQVLADGSFFAKLPPPLQGVCQLRLECALAFYNRVGWREDFLDLGPGVVLSQDQIAAVREKHPLECIHDLSYLPPKHLEKLLGKDEPPLLFDRVAELVA